MRALRQHDSGEGHVIAEIYAGPDYSEFKDIFYSWVEVPEGVVVYCKKPILMEHHAPDSLSEDVTIAIKEELDRHIVRIEWI